MDKIEKSKVYFTKEITPESVVKMYEVLEKELPEKVAVKVHSGEEGNQNYLCPEFMKKIIEKVNGTIVECNTAYEGQRNSTEDVHHQPENRGYILQGKKKTKLSCGAICQNKTFS